MGRSVRDDNSGAASMVAPIRADPRARNATGSTRPVASEDTYSEWICRLASIAMDDAWRGAMVHRRYDGGAKHLLDRHDKVMFREWLP